MFWKDFLLKLLSLKSPHRGKPPLAPLTDRIKPAVWAATPREAGWIYLCWFLWPKGHMHKTWIGSVASHCQSQFTMAKTGVNCQIRLFVSVVATFDCQRLKCMKRHGKVLLKFPERCLLFIIMTWCTPGFQKFAAQFRYTKYYKAIVSKSLLRSNPQTCCLLFDRCISLKSFQNQTFWR